jgi:uncharacterized protein (DUF2235 family)
MPKNIVICFDGTNNTFGPQNTNVVRLVQMLDRNPLTQRLYYDPGVGTLPEPGVWSAIGKRVSEIYGLAFGRGFSWKVQEAYSYLMDFWEPGDQVLVFGFSRGAYSARVLAGMLHALGLLPRGNHNLVPYVMNLYGAMRGERSSPKSGERSDPRQWTTLCDQFRWTFARVVPEDQEQRHFHVHYLGLWDTVSSVGWVWDPAKYPFTARNPSVHAARHAVSIDERRWFFRQNRLNKATPDQRIDELWFPGVHSDIGGGYSQTDGGLWREPFVWILAGAEIAGLKVDQSRKAQILPPAQPDATSTDPKHESLHGSWWLAEFFPKLQWNSLRKKSRLAIGGGRFRSIGTGDRMHRSAILRLRNDTTYRPDNLAPEFVDAVRARPTVPDTIAYEGGMRRQKLGGGLVIVAVLCAALVTAIAVTLLLRGGIWIAERTNAECGEAQTGPPFETRRPCWDVGQRVKPGRQYRLRLTVDQPWVDLDIAASPSGFGVSQMTLVGNIFTPLRRSLFNQWFTPMVKIVPASGGFTLVPVEMHRTATREVDYIGEFTAPHGGRVFMFVNDVILPPWVPKHRYFYDNNKGTVSAIQFEETDK